MAKSIAKTENSNVSTANVSTAKVAKVAKVEKIKVIRVTADEKVATLKQAISNQFKLSQEQITNFTINKLAKSTKKINLVEFYEKLIVQLVVNPETINKF